MDDIFIVGGGPSLKGLDWNRLRGKYLVAINRAFQTLPFARFIYFSDARFFHWHAEALRVHTGLKITGDPSIKDWHVHNMKFTGLEGLELERGGLRTGNNSGHAAINLAVHLRPKRIILLGYDMAYSGAQTHWHDGYPVAPGAIHKMLPYFETMLPVLAQLNIDVVNANPDSAIQCFRKESLNNVLQ